MHQNSPLNLPEMARRILSVPNLPPGVLQRDVDRAAAEPTEITVSDLSLAQFGAMADAFKDKWGFEIGEMLQHQVDKGIPGELAGAWANHCRNWIAENDRRLRAEAEFHDGISAHST